jgi:hypothetical protein
VLGILIGGIVGLRRAGRRRQLAEFGVALLIVAGLAFLGVREAGGYRYTPPDAPAPLPARVLVTVENLNVRPAPSTANDPLTQAARGTALAVVGAADGWYEVAFEQDGTRYRGWVDASYVAPAPEAAEAEADDPRALVVPLGASARVRAPSGTGERYSAQVLRGRAVREADAPATRVELRVRVWSEDYRGTWADWAAVARASRLLAPDGSRYDADAHERAGADGPARPGASREGTLVFHVPAAPETVGTWYLHLAPSPGRAWSLILPLDGRTRPVPPAAADRADAPPQPPGRLYEAGELDAPPRPRRALPRVDTGLAGYAGTVHLQVIVGTDGRVERATCLDTDRVPASVCRDATRAVRGVPFRPGREGRRDVRSRTTLALSAGPSPGRTAPQAAPGTDAPAPRPEPPPETLPPQPEPPTPRPQEPAPAAPSPRADGPAGTVGVSVEGLGGRGASCPRPRHPGVGGTATYAVTFAPDGRYVSSRPLLRGGDARIDQAVRAVLSGCRAQAQTAGDPGNQEGRVTFRFAR